MFFRIGDYYKVLYIIMYMRFLFYQSGKDDSTWLSEELDTVN